MYNFGGPWGTPCGNLGNTKSQECGRTREFGVTQRSLTTTVYTSFKYVTTAFGLNEESKQHGVLVWSQATTWKTYEH